MSSISTVEELEEHLHSEMYKMLADPFLEKASEHFGVPANEVTQEMRDEVRKYSYPSLTFSEMVK